jgi:hypothetical protein
VTPAPRRLQKGEERARRGTSEPLHSTSLHMSPRSRKPRVVPLNLTDEELRKGLAVRLEAADAESVAGGQNAKRSVTPVSHGNRKMWPARQDS